MPASSLMLQSPCVGSAKQGFSNLPGVHNGGQASEAFLSLKDKTPEEQKKIRDALLKYCKLDTLAMVKIWENLKEVTD